MDSTPQQLLPIGQGRSETGNSFFLPPSSPPPPPPPPKKKKKPIQSSLPPTKTKLENQYNYLCAVFGLLRNFPAPKNILYQHL